MPKVMIAPSHLATWEGPFLEELASAGLELVYPPEARQLGEDEVIAQFRGISATLAGSEPYTRKVFESLPELRVVARAGVGYDAVDVAAATEMGVAVTFAPGSNHEAVAEHTFLLMLSLAKSFLLQDSSIRDGKWPRRAYLPLRGQTVGIVGLGRIGKAVAVRAQAFRMRVIAAEPEPDHAFVEQYGIGLVPHEELFREADFVTLHCPLTARTRGLINAESLGLMKPTAFLINTSRGPVIDEADLTAALRERRIAGAGIDVFAHEPPGGEHPYVGLDNVVLTAHTAGVDRQSLGDMAYLAALGIARLSKGEWPSELIVNPEVKPKFRFP